MIPTLAVAAEQICSRGLSPVELTRACLERIGRLDPELNAFITVTADLALEQARAAEAEINAGGWRGPLHGIPIALKDLIDVAGVEHVGALTLKGFGKPVDSFALLDVDVEKVPA